MQCVPVSYESWRSGLIISSSELDRQLSYNMGVLDGLGLAVQVIRRCPQDGECKDRMAEKLSRFALSIALERAELLMHIHTDESVEQFVQR